MIRAMPTIENRVEAILEELRPYIQSDGGDLEFVGIENEVVKVRMNGLCATCPSSQLTLKEGIERILKREVPEISGVVAINL